MGRIRILVLAFLVTGSIAQAFQQEFPTNPDQQVTPGTFCTHPNSYRYKEHIPYCNRNVSSQEKLQIIATYNDTLGYRIDLKQRSQYKIDHLIPLCAGGSNDKENLWPQHKSVYTITDPVEQLACERMVEGKLLQKQAVELIFKAKDDLSKAEEVIDYLRAM